MTLLLEPVSVIVVYIALWDAWRYGGSVVLGVLFIAPLGAYTLI